MGLLSAHHATLFFACNRLEEQSQSRRASDSFRVFSSMETLPPNVSESEDIQPLTQANKRSKTLIDGDPIPFDLIVDIFLRLPAKTIARCRCVSKRWASILGLQLFTDLYLARPKLLFACYKDGHVFFFSSPQPQSLEDNSSLITASCYRIKIPNEYPHEISSYDIGISSIKGLVFLRIQGVLKGKGHASVILNPSTGQSLTLPKVKSRRKIGVRSYFGYDPTEKQYKVLSMTWLFYGSRWLVSEEHQVLTLGGTGEPSWRKIECPIPHTLNYTYHHVCIDGVLYYPAEKSTREFIIVCFDVRSETFRFVKYPHSFYCAPPLINYHGKLASLGSEETMDGSYTCIKFRVLEDVERQEWSQRRYKLPDLWYDIVGEAWVRFVGVTRTNEIVLCSSSHQFLLYYNTERNTVIKVEIQGMEAVKHSQIFTMQDHVEDLKLV